MKNVGILVAGILSGVLTVIVLVYVIKPIFPELSEKGFLSKAVFALIWGAIYFVLLNLFQKIFGGI
jgi:hypothetical protein